MHLTRLVEDIIADPDLAQEPESTRVACCAGSVC